VHRALAAIGLLWIASLSGQSVPRQDGAAEAWQKMQKLRTTVSVMHITAHPDDEHGGVLTKLSRGDGARVTLLTLNRGESGDNAIGPQLFDALGLIRTEELLVAGRYYGLDQQYFTTVVDYGFSKTLEESIGKWGRETVLRDVVRIVRMERPTIILSRFQGNERDGHGNHQTAGLMAQEAFRAAGDPKRYPDQIAQGLRPWQPKKVYIGGVRENEDWTVRIDSGEYNPRLGDSYDNIARYGLSFQRSQVSGRFTPSAGANFGYYSRMDTKSGKESTIFDGLPANIEAGIGAAGKRIDDAVAKAMAAFTMNDPSASVPALVEGLKLTREALAATKDLDARHVLTIKEQQFQDAINSAMGMELTAMAQPAGMPEPAGPGAAFAPPALMAAPVPGQTFEVRARLANRGGIPVTIGGSPLSDVGREDPRLEAAAGWRVMRIGADPAVRLNRHESVTSRYTVTLANDVALSTRPYFYRNGLQESVYTLSDPSQFGRPVSTPPLRAVARYSIDGVPIEIRDSVKRREAKLPYGDVLREVRSVPRISVTTTPSNAIVPVQSATASTSAQSATADKKAVALQTIDIEVTLLHNAETPSFGQLTLQMPEGWTSKPGSQAFRFERSGERASFRFAVRPTAVGARTYEIDAVAIDGLGEYRQGYELIDHRDLEVRYLYREAQTTVRGVDVTTVSGLKVGYVMGVGDQVPSGLQQLGAQVTLLGERELASANLSQFDTIMTGTRAYAVREDLKTYNSRLIEYVRNGGNMVVLYNTQELVPNTFAPFPGELPRGAEEVSEEDSPVNILAPQHQVFNWPNRITNADFDGWVEQRGSKFFTKWDASYTPMISTYDKGQAPQSGGWLTARVGKGTWTYFAYALHRQLPYGVPGAYRITANLLALNKQPR
jgi:LmbE family N-acetylglucosaminyl deacetylase